MYWPGRVIAIGGGVVQSTPDDTAEYIDLQGTQGWQSTGSMGHPRRHLNATLDAHGDVYVTGGTSAVAGGDVAGEPAAVQVTARWRRPGLTAPGGD
jgi:hypothetical protein